MTSRPPLRDYAHSRAVVVGTWNYDFLPDLPAAGHSLRRMKRLLTSPLCGWPRDRISTFGNRRIPGNLPDRLITLFENARDVALFYYVGHGQIDADEQLCLCLGGSRTEPHRRSVTSLPFQAVRRALLESPATTKIIILDCCFSGLANSRTNTMAAAPDSVMDKTGGTGAYTMAASSAYATAWYENDPGLTAPQTYFTKYFADLVEKGIPGLPAEIRLHQVFTKLRDNLSRDQRPVPDQRSIDAAREFVFAYNAAPPDTLSDTQAELRRLNLRLAEMEAEVLRLRAIQQDLDPAANEEQRRQLDLAVREAERQIGETTAGLAAIRAEQISPASHAASPSAPAQDHRPATPKGRSREGIKGRPQPPAEDRQPAPAKGRLRATAKAHRPAPASNRSAAAQLARAASPILVPEQAQPPAEEAVGPLAAETAQVPAGEAAVPTAEETSARAAAASAVPAATKAAVPTAATAAVLAPGESPVPDPDAPPGGVAAPAAPSAAEVALSLVVGDEPGTGARDGQSVTNPERSPARLGASPAGLRPGAPQRSRPPVTRRRALISLGAAAAVAGVSALGWELSRSSGPSSPASSALALQKTPAPTPSQTPAPSTRLWQFTAQGSVGSRPTVSGGVVYFGSDDHSVYAVDVKHGHQIWRYPTDGVVVSSPAVVDGVVYVGSEDGRVLALDAIRGHQIWAFATNGSVEASPVVVDGTVYVGSQDGNVYAITLDGHQKWAVGASPPVNSSPTVDAGIVYIGDNSGVVHAIDAIHGTTLRTFQADGYVDTSPAVSNSLVYFGSSHGYTYALHTGSLKQAWAQPTGSIQFSSPAVADGTVYIGSHDNSVHALDAQTGRRRWTYRTGDAVDSSPAVAGGTVYVGSNDSNLYALSTRHGTVRWSFGTSNHVFSSPTVADGVVYFGSDDHNLYAVEA